MSADRLRAALRGSYRIERELGAGGMATVYLAHDVKHDRKVALKVLKPELGAVLGAERFLSEIKVTANLQHPNLLPLFDSGAADGLLYYVMPYIEGETLRARLDRERQLPVDETVRLIALMAGALDYAHARGVVHRDLKPENILLQAGQPVIADFGIALAVAHAGGARITKTGLSLGTPHYMSPEQAAGDRAVDARSDQYSLGALTYEMLTGEPPHTGATAQVIIARVMTETPRSVRTARPAVSPTMDEAILRALAKAPADRFTSCGEFARVARDTAGMTTAAAPPRQARRVGAALVALAIIGAFVALMLWRRGSFTTAVESASVAVLPFVDLSPDRANAYLGDGMAETLINALTNVTGLSVAARTSAFSFRDKAEDVREIGKQLGVATVLEGSVQRSGDRLRVTAQLIKASDGLHLWSQNFDRSANDIFAVQDEVARAVVTELQGKLIARSDSAASGGTRNPVAYNAYLLGRFYWNKRTGADMVRAADYFEQAIHADSAYAQAWTGLADSYVLFGPAEYAVPGINQDSILTLAEYAARRAIAISPRLGEPHTSLGEILEYRDRWNEAGEAFRQGIALSPRYATGHQWYSYDLMVWNRWDEAIREMERARELDPLSLVIVVSLALAYDGADRAADAGMLYDQAQALYLDHPLTLLFRFAHNLVLHRTDQAASDLRRWMIMAGTDRSKAARIERGLRGPALRSGAIREIAAGPYLEATVVLHRVFDGDDATIAYLASLVKSPRREAMNKDILLGFLGPRLRVNPRTQDILVHLGYPRPQDFKGGQ